jgi:EAL domain-containing protein (putative c-di-GMP-specific phosphodiesterase class I)
MLPLGEWILRQACLDAAAWPAHIRVAVNMSAAQFHKSNMLDVVLCTLVESGLSPERLELEIPDAALLDGNLATHLLTVRQLKNLGVGVVLDNCGVGYSAASYLHNFPFDKFKIDREIVQGCATRRDCAAVIASAVALAHGLGITTVAKGVESPAQFEALNAAGVDFAQGYLFGRPVPNSEINFEPPLPVQNVA